MRELPLQLGRFILILLAMVSVVTTFGCRGDKPSLSSPLPAPSMGPTPSVGTPLLPGAPAPVGHGKILLLFGAADLPSNAVLEISSPDGRVRQPLAQGARDSSSVAVSPDKRHVAFFTADVGSDGALAIWDVQRGTIFQMPVAGEVSTSFRDALPVRHLAWSPDGQSLAIAMNRDLYLLDTTQLNVQVIVRHREERYTLAGLVMGSIGHPTWTTDGGTIVYDAFVPPDVLSAGADRYRDVECVTVSTGMMKPLLEDAHIVRRTTAPGGQELILQHEDERFFSLNLSTPEIQETVPPLETRGPWLCDPKNESCVSIISEQGEHTALALTQQREEIHRLHLADLGQSTSGCQFQSTLWSPHGDSLLTTIGCAERVSLWSIEMSDLGATHLTDWANFDSAVLLCWFE